MNNSETLDYDDFDALLDASSLGAPRVVAALGSATPDALRRFNTAAHLPLSCSPAPTHTPADTAVQTQRLASSSPAGRAAVTGIAVITCSTGAGKTNAFLDQISQARRRRDIAEGFTVRPARVLAVTARSRPHASVPLLVIDEAHRSTSPWSAREQTYLAALLRNRERARSDTPRHLTYLYRLFHQSSEFPTVLRRIELAACVERDALHDMLVRRLLADLGTTGGAGQDRAAPALRLATWTACMWQDMKERNLLGQAWPRATAFHPQLVHADGTQADLGSQSFPRMSWNRTGGPGLDAQRMRCLRHSCLQLASMPPTAPFINRDPLLERLFARLDPAHGARSLARSWLTHISTDERLSWPHAPAPADNGWLPVLYTCACSETEHAEHVTAPLHCAPREPDLATLRAPRPARSAHHATDRAAHNDQRTIAPDSTAEKRELHDISNGQIELRQEMVHAWITTHLYLGGGNEIPLPLPTHLNYRVTDPYAVEAVFDPGPHQVTWTFARDLLADGLHDKAGSGDISIWTSPSDSGHPRAFMQLKSPTGTALLSLPPTPVREFLTETTRMVPRGSEHALLSSSLNDLEAQLNQLSVSPGGGD
ncbi:SsgA family sporulation/cell division regulator [Streptomyces sp. Agncl-13]|uniref:SsgA family sporulation/cell division regulator n=1 Tax=Streptomyces sp. Agncl-13 TaxID=3400628 RepID=UPI003A839ACE